MQLLKSSNTSQLILVLFLAASAIIFIRWSDKNPKLKSGIWKTSIHRKDGQEIVFNFETKDSAGRQVMYVLNGGEKLLVDQLTYRGDSVFIEMPFFESGFAAKLDEKGNLQGSWIKKGASLPVIMPFNAVYNQKQRFPVLAPPAHHVSGRWAVTFTDRNNVVTEAVGEFQQEGSRLTGTFLTSSGDYRYQEGVVSGDTLKLSGFDGGHAYLFIAKIQNDSVISSGNFYSGAVNVEKWTAKKDSKAALPDEYAETTLRPGENKLNFRFPSTDGKIISINDEAYKGKVVIVQILGSWCPNCMDETRFLSEYYNANKNKGLEIIGLAYERTTDLERSRKSIKAFQQRFNVEYPILITGVTVSDSLRTEKTLPQLNKLKAFPTSLFINKKGIVEKIYTGFTGPGTGAYYEAFVKEFDKTVKGLLAE